MINDDFKIVLKPTLDFKKEDIQNQLNKYKFKINVVGITFDKNKFNKEEIIKKQNQLSKMIGKVPINFKLNIDDETKSSINKQINRLKLDSVLLDFKLNISEKNINNINNQIKKLKLKNIKLDVGIDKIEDNKIIPTMSSKKSTTDTTTDNVPTLISHQEKFKDDTLTDITNVYRKNALEIEKVIQKFDEEGNQIDVLVEKTKEYEKISKSLYDKLKKQNQELTKLEEQKINAIKSGILSNENYDNLIEKQKNFIKITEDEINSLNLKNKQLEFDIDTGKETDKLKEQLRLYKELEKSVNILNNLEQKKSKGQDINANEYDKVINKQKEIIDNIKKVIESRGLANAELNKQIDNLQKINEISIQDKAKARQIKIGELYESEATKNLSYESSKKELEEFGKATFENFEKITSIKDRIQDLNHAQKQFTVAVKTGKGQVTEYTYAIDKATRNVYKLGEKVRRVNTTIAGFGSMLSEMVEKVFQWNIATSLVFKSIELFQQGVGYIIELDSVLTEVALVTGQTREETESLKEVYSQLGTETRKTMMEIAKLNVELVRQGLSQEETQNRLESILKLSAVSGMDTNETLKVITSSVNALGEEAKKTADVLVYADNASASSVESIGKAMARVSSTAKTSEVSIEQLVGQIATLIDVTQEAPETLGNALKSIMARFSKINEIGEFNESLNDVERAFTRVGIAFKNSEGQIRPFYDLMGDMAKIFPTLDKNTKSMVATLSAGTQQQNRFLALMQNWEKVEELTQQLETRASGSLEKGYKVWKTSLKADLNELQLAFENLWNEFIDEEALSVFIRFGTDLINTITKISKVINPVSLAMVGLFRHFRKENAKAIEDHFTGIIKNTMRLAKATGKQVVENGVLEKSNIITGKSFSKLSEITKKNNDTLNRRKAIAKSIVAGQNAMTVSINKTKLAMIGMEAVKTVGWVVFIDLAIKGLTSLQKAIFPTRRDLEDIMDTLNETVSSFKDLSTTHKDNISTLKELSDEFDRLNKKITENYDTTKLSTEEKQNYFDIMNKISEIAPEFISHWDNEGNAIIKYGTRIEDIIKLKKELYKIDRQAKISEFQEQLPDLDKIIDKQLSKIDKIQSKIRYNAETGIAKSSRFLFEDYTTDIQIQKQEAIIEDPNSSTKQIKNAQEKINEINSSINEFKKELSIANAEFNKIIQPFKEFLNLNISEYFSEIGNSINEIDKDLIRNTINDFSQSLLETGTKGEKIFDNVNSMTKELVEYAQKVRNILQDTKITGLSENIDKLEQFKQELIDLGLNSDYASKFIDNLSFKIVGLGANSENVKNSISGLSNEIANTFNKIKKWQEVLQKSFTDTLSIDEVLDVMQEYPEVIEKINNGMELNNAIKEISINQIEKLNEENLKNIQNIEKENISRKNSLLSQQKEIENTLHSLEQKGKTETTTYKEAQKDLQKINQELKNVDDETNKNISTINAYKKVSEEFFEKQQFDIISEQFDMATDNIRKYQEMLNTINEKGITNDIIRNIISNYPNLISYINDEISLRNVLNDLIKSEENIQKEAYRLKLMYSEQFANTFLKINSDMLNKLSEKYNIDLKNFKTVQEQKVGLLNEINKKLAMSNTQLSSSFSGMTTQQLEKEIEERQKRIENLSSKTNLLPDMRNIPIGILKKEIEAINDLLEHQKGLDIELDKTFENINIDKIKTDKISSSDKSATKTKKTYIDLITLEKEEYLKLNTALEKNNYLIDKNNSLEKYAFGSDRIKVMTDENNLLTERQKLLHNLANQYREEQANLKKSISKVIKLDKDEGLSNFTKYMKSKENEINNIIKKINATTNQSLVENLTTKKEKLEKEVNKFADEYKRYIEITFNTIPDLQKKYDDLIFKKFDNIIDIMKTKIDKYEKEIGRLNVLQKLSITGKKENYSELERELKIHEEISNIYYNELSITKTKAEETKKQVDDLTKKLNSIKDKNSADYQKTYDNLITAKFLSDEALKMYEANLESYADSLNSKVNIEIQLLDKIREKAKSSLTDLRKELDNFTMTEFNNNMQKIILELDKMDKIFISNPQLSLDTSETRNQIKEIEKSIDDIRKNTDKWKNRLNEVKNSNKSNKDILKEIDKISKELIKSENVLNEQIAKKNEEILKLELEYTKIENSLQNQIDLKQQEIEKIQEEQEHNEKINSLISKRLELLGAIDDKSHIYITGQGEVEYTYDKGRVNSLLQQLQQEETKNKTDENISKIQEEIDKMVENLNRTKDIHQQNLSVNQAQLKQLEEERNYISNIIDKSLEQIDNSFDKMIDNYIDELNKNFQQNTGILINIYNLLKQNIGSSNFNYKNIDNKSKEIIVGKGEDTLEKIAKKYNTTVDKILALNLGLSKNEKLMFGQKINIPSFDTGGYTGSFGSQGKLAMLHEKEIVLNKYDTKNLLDIIDITRSLFSTDMFASKNKNTETNINIENIILNNVKDGNSFVNELQRITRNGMGRLN